MNRVIKYRGLHPLGNWIHGLLVCNIPKSYQIKQDDHTYLVKDETVGEFTGFHDKNGVEIYEGDIIEFDRNEWGGDDNIHIVTWDKAEGAWCFGGGYTSDMAYRKAVGNTHQNKELLEVKDE